MCFTKSQVTLPRLRPRLDSGVGVEKHQSLSELKGMQIGPVSRPCPPIPQQAFALINSHVYRQQSSKCTEACDPLERAWLLPNYCKEPSNFGPRLESLWRHLSFSGFENIVTP